MTNTQYDEKSNTLFITRNATNNALTPEVAQQRNLRGFIITVVNNDEELAQVQNGEFNSMQLCPVLATDEDEAIRYINEQGKIIINVTNYEFLKLQLELIEKLSKQQNIELVQLKLFDVKDT